MGCRVDNIQNRLNKSMDAAATVVIQFVLQYFFFSSYSEVKYNRVGMRPKCRATRIERTRCKMVLNIECNHLCHEIENPKTTSI